MPIEADLTMEEHRIGENCAVFGVFAPGLDVARMACTALFAVQHRGEEAGGIAVSNHEWSVNHTGMGLVSQVLTENTLKMLKGGAAIGHNRYSTTGASKLENAQPVVLDEVDGKHLALAHNGNLINTLELAQTVKEDGREISATTDSMVMARALFRAYRDMPIEDAVKEVFPEFLGAYSLVILTCDELVAVRDPMGFPPLSFGRPHEYYCIAS